MSGSCRISSRFTAFPRVGIVVLLAPMQFEEVLVYLMSQSLGSPAMAVSPDSVGKHGYGDEPRHQVVGAVPVSTGGAATGVLATIAALSAAELARI